MTVSAVLFYTRRADMSPADFKDYMERIHVPLITKAMGIHAPITYTRRYVVRVDSGAGDRLGAPCASTKSSAPTAPVVLVGSPDDLDWDMMGEMVFRDELHLMQGYGSVDTSEGQAVKDDEENFTDPNKFKIIMLGDIISS